MIQRLIDGDSVVIFDPESLHYSIFPEGANEESYSAAERKLQLRASTLAEANPYLERISTIDTLAIANTMSCNMTCDYCYCGELPLVGQNSSLSDHQRDQVEHFLRARAGSAASLIFIGGEPFVGARSLRATVEMAQAFSAKLDIDLSVTIYTNGLALNEKWMKWVNQNQIRLLISLDGPPIEHDSRRHLRNGRPSSKQIRSNILRYMAEYWSRHRSVRCVAPNSPHLERLPEYFLALGFNDIGIQPLYDETGNQDPMTIDDHLRAIRWYGQKLRDSIIFRLEPYTGLFIRLAKRGKAVQSHFPCTVGGGMCGLSDSGNLTPCHHFFGDLEYDQYLDRDKWYEARPELSLPVDQREPCRKCFAKYLCGGECYHRAYVATGDYFGTIATNCASRQSLVAPIVREFDKTMRIAPMSILRLARGDYTEMSPDEHAWTAEKLEDFDAYNR